jgi:hypothetical protein
MSLGLNRASATGGGSFGSMVGACRTASGVWGSARPTSVLPWTPVVVLPSGALGSMVWLTTPTPGSDPSLPLMKSRWNEKPLNSMICFRHSRLKKKN